MLYDVVIVGGGPGGLAAALTLGRSRKRVLLCDSGPRRNAAAEHIHNFVTRDGTSPEEFRRIGREQLAAYPNVEVRDVRVESISGARGAFHVRLASGAVPSRRVLLCTGMIDESLPIDGFRELWGHAIFQCPYCHGWEVQDRRWGCLLPAADAEMFLPFALMARGWTRDVVVFTGGTFDVPAETRAQLQGAGIRIETDPVRRLVARGRQLEGVELSTGVTVPCDVLFAHPSQRQVDLIQSLGVALDEHGYVRIDAMKSETSIPGVYAAGDLTTRGQGAIWAAAAGARAATMINFELTMELAAAPTATLGGAYSSDSTPALAPTGTRASEHGARPHDHDHEHVRPHDSHGAGGPHHAFADADALTQVFDDPARDAWQRPDDLLRAFELEPAMTVADVGAGTGYFSVRLARAVPQGEVIATDLEPDMVRFLSERARREQLPNLRIVQATPTASGLSPGSVDRILVVHVWHHLADRGEYARGLAAALRPGGRLLVADFGPTAHRGPPASMRVAPEAVIAELEGAGLSARVSPIALPDQYIVEGRRRP